MLFFRVTPPLHLMVGVLTAVRFSVHTAGPHEVDSMSPTSAAVTFGMSILLPHFLIFLPLQLIFLFPVHPPVLLRIKTRRKQYKCTQGLFPRSMKNIAQK